MKNIPIKRLIALLLAAACMLALLAGCGKKDGDDGQGGGSGSNGGTNPDFVYVASYLPMEGEFDYIGAYSAAVYGEKLFFNSYISSSVAPDGTVLTEDDEDYWSYYNSIPGLFSVDMTTGKSEQLTGYEPYKLPEGYEGGANLQSLCIDPDGNIWVCENVYAYHYDAPEGVTEEDEDYYNYFVQDEDSYMIRKLDSTGAELATLDLSAVSEDYNKSMPDSGDEMMFYSSFYVNRMAVDGAGNIYISTGQSSVYVLDQQGAILFKLEMENWLDSLVMLSDGSIAAMGGTMDGDALMKIDVNAKAWGDKLEKPYNCYYFYPGGGDYLFYSSSGSSLYGYNAATGENEKLLNWLSSDVDGNSLSVVVPLADGRIMALEQSEETTSSNSWRLVYNLVTLTKTPASEVPQKTTLTFACNYLGSIRSQILNFNRKNDKYRIEVIDYSEYNTEDDYSAGLTKLTTEITSGNVPDLLSTDSLPIAKYSAKGLLEDLYPYLDSDSELGRDKIVPAVLKSLETDGKLYQIVDRFSVNTVVGDASKVGSEPGWTLDELMALMETMPEDMDIFENSMTRDGILSTACAFSIADFVNWQTGECSFDSEGFVKILEFANTFPASFDWDNYEYSDEDSEPNRIMSGKQLLSQIYLSDFENIQMYDAMFNNNMVFKGFPCESRNGSALNFYSGVAMTSSCKDKEGAWEFLRSILTEEYQNKNIHWYFPTNQAAFDAKLEEAMKVEYEIDPETGEPLIDPETGEKVERSKGGYGWGSLMIEIYAIKPEQADAIKEAINSVSRSYTYDEDIMNIITEEAAAYFNGDKTAQQVADLIQSRAKIYVNEQR